jgi:hypothetical protein
MKQNNLDFTSIAHIVWHHLYSADLSRSVKDSLGSDVARKLNYGTDISIRLAMYRCIDSYKERINK